MSRLACLLPLFLAAPIGAEIQAVHSFTDPRVIDYRVYLWPGGTTDNLTVEASILPTGKQRWALLFDNVEVARKAAEMCPFVKDGKTYTIHGREVCTVNGGRGFVVETIKSN